MTKKELFIGRINAAVTNDQLQHYFNSFGQVNSFKRPVDRRTGRNREFAFVSFVEPDVFENVKGFQKHSVNGFPIDVRVSIPKEDFRAKRKEESLGVVEIDQAEIGKKFYKNSMLEDPWRNCNPQQSDPTRARFDSNTKHRNRLFHRVGADQLQMPQSTSQRIPSPRKPTPPYYPANSNYQSAPPALRPPILRGPSVQPPAQISKNNPPPPPPLKRAPQINQNRSEPPAQMPKITSFTSQLPANTDPTPRIPLNGEQLHLYLNNKLPTSKVLEDFTIEKNGSISLCSSVDGRLLEYFIRIFITSKRKELKLCKITQAQECILETLAKKHELVSGQEKIGFVLKKSS